MTQTAHVGDHVSRSDEKVLDMHIVIVSRHMACGNWLQCIGTDSKQLSDVRHLKHSSVCESQH